MRQCTEVPFPRTTPPTRGSTADGGVVVGSTEIRAAPTTRWGVVFVGLGLLIGTAGAGWLPLHLEGWPREGPPLRMTFELGRR